MTLHDILNALLEVTGAMSPYLLLGFLIAGVLHVFVPKRFYAKYLSRDNKWSVLWAALLGVPLPLCSCGVISTAVGLKNEGASKGAVATSSAAAACGHQAGPAAGLRGRKADGGRNYGVITG